jgi:hypothetical protein
MQEAADCETGEFGSCSAERFGSTAKRLLCKVGRREYRVLSRPGMSSRGFPEGHMGHICVDMRATHDMRPACRMFDMPDRVCFLCSEFFFTLGNSLIIFPSVKKHSE